MTEQMHRRPRRDTETDAVVEQEKAEANEVSEAAACCLADIDEVLAEQDRELTDEEVLAKGEPSKDAVHEAREAYYGQGGGTYQEYRLAYDQWQKEVARYGQAYQNVTGMEYQRDCGCGC